MNHSMPGSGQPQHISPAVPMYPPPQSRRQQEYHAHAYHQQGPPPQSPMHPQAYPGYHPHYYPHPGPVPYQQPRWQPPYAPPYVQSPQPRPSYQQHPSYNQQQPPQQHQQQPQQPMVVSSRPGPSMMPDSRLPPMPPRSLHSPAPIPPRAYQQMPQAPPSPAPTPKHEPPSAPPPAVEQEIEDEMIGEQMKEQEPPSPRKAETPAPASRRQSLAQSSLALAPEHKAPFYPQLPWFSVPGSTFPRRDIARRRRRQTLHKTNDDVALPAGPAKTENVEEKTVEEAPSEASTIAAPSEPETPATSQAPSESDFTQISTPATPAQPAAPSPKATPTQTQTHARRDTRTAIAVPNIPGLPKPKSSPATDKQAVPPPAPSTTDQTTPTPENQATAQADGPDQDGAVEQTAGAEEAAPETPPPKAAPKSWADLVRTKAAPGSAAAQTNGTSANGVLLPKSASLAEALRQYSVQSDASLSFLEPRGLVNTGNMCYMNAILQVLVFCAPFYGFLDQVRQRTVHSMKSDTPLVDAMIMFMREFKVLVSAESVEILRRSLKSELLEQYGEPVTPEYVYDAIRKLPRFQGMRRGHQQDAEEFLGFLLEGLHDECALVMQSAVEEEPRANGVAASPAATESPSSADGWLEVGPKQKASTTRTAGQYEAPSPITKIFGGNLRSELRVPGVKDSITLEPYKPLQLDIGASHVNNIVDALKGLTRTESLSGDFGGRGNTAKKQVFIDTLPPVLILHLKRFQYDNNLTGTQKIWKKVGYPLELEIPKDVFPTAKRGGFAVKGGLPKYRLIGVVYHHGKSAAGGHYTVDILRQDSREWIRMDDTIIRRIRAEDVAEGGSEEDPKILAKALEQHKADQELQKQRNIYQGLDEAEKEPEEEKPWSEVNGGGMLGHRKQFSAAITTNGTATPTSTNGKRTPTAARREGVKDNKVAYILLYERMSG